MSRPLMTDADRADVFRGLAHPLRRRVLGMLGRREMMVSEMLERLGRGLTLPALSRHLRVLRDAGLVRQRLDGYRRYYRVNNTSLNRARQWLNRNS